MAVTFKSNLDFVLKTAGKNTRQAAQKVGDIAVESVQMKMLYGYNDSHGDPPHSEIVDTGRLFDSIEADVKQASQNLVSVSVGTGVLYAKYVHDGTYKLKGRPFLQDGLQDAMGAIEKALSENWRNGFK
jgi:hypothetical protein